MITEGLHPEIGKGIFIKEIYSDSVAENSELQVSDMLISVNQIQLINMDYDLVSWKYYLKFSIMDKALI